MIIHHFLLNLFKPPGKKKKTPTVLKRCGTGSRCGRGQPLCESSYACKPSRAIWARRPGSFCSRNKPPTKMKPTTKYTETKMPVLIWDQYDGNTKQIHIIYTHILYTSLHLSICIYIYKYKSKDMILHDYEFPMHPRVLHAANPDLHLFHLFRHAHIRVGLWFLGHLVDGGVPYPSMKGVVRGANSWPQPKSVI